MRPVKLKGMRQINGLHYAPDGRRLLVVGGAEVRMQDEAVWIDVGEMKETLRIRLFGESYAVTPDLTRLALGNAHQFRGSKLGAVSLLDLTGAAPSRRFKLPVADAHVFVYGLTFSPDASRLAISWEELSHRPDGDFLDVWTLAKPKEREMTFFGIGTPVVTFDPAGHRLAASGGIDGEPEVHVVDTPTRTVRMFKPKGSQTRQLVYAPDGGTLAAANGKTVLLLPPDLSAPRHTLAHPKQVNAVAFTPDGRRLLTTCTDKQVRVWDVAGGQLVSIFDWNIGATTAVAVAPDGLTAAVGGQKGQVVLFDLDG
jgi:WD40 repeat protein